MRLSDKQILVTGANGFIGSHLVRRLANAEAGQVRVFIRPTARWPEDLERHPSVESCFGDIRDKQAVQRAVAGCELVVHAAAVQPFSPLPSRGEFDSVNVGATANLLQASKKAGISRFLLVSTINVHGIPPPPNANADSPLRHSGDRYSDSKVDGERAAWSFAREENFPLTVIRPACTFGPGSKAWTLQPLDRIRRGVPVLFGAGRGICNPVYIDNLVDLIVAVLTSDKAVGQAFIGSDGVGVEWRQFYAHYAALCRKPSRSIPTMAAQLLAIASLIKERLTGQPGPLSPSSLAFYTHQVVFDVEKNKRILGHIPRVSFEDAMQRTGDWLREEKLV